MNNLVATIILYNPDILTIKKVFINASYFNKTYIIDNSDNGKDYSDGFFSAAFLYIKTTENIGIAAALNIGAYKAIADGYKFMITLDQDTLLPENFIEKLTENIKSFDFVGILSPYHNTANKVYKGKNIEEVLTTLTSANILNLKIFREIGGFEEKLFIDYVDNEYCLRLNSNGYKVLRNNSVQIEHPLGEIVSKKIVLIPVYPTNHDQLRLYYRTRNRLYCIKKYGKRFPVIIKDELKSFCKEIIKITIFEKNKFDKFRMIWKGVIDFMKNKYGKYE